MTGYLALSGSGREFVPNSSVGLYQGSRVFIPDVSLSSAELQGSGVKVAFLVKS
jgi:hypothetical protein